MVCATRRRGIVCSYLKFVCIPYFFVFSLVLFLFPCKVGATRKGKIVFINKLFVFFSFCISPLSSFYFAATYVPPERDKLLPRGESHWQVGGSKKEIIKLPPLPSHFHFISPPPSSSKVSNDSSGRHRCQFNQKITIIILFSIRRRGQVIPLINEG